MPLTGGKLSRVTGFVAPVVGLGAPDGHSLYIGELTGQVFKVNNR